jgi:hypothetical protein
MGCATAGTGPFPLIEIERFQDISTRRTRLRRWIPPVNLDQRASVPLRLVFQLTHQLAPAHIADGLGEGMVSEHVFHRQGLDAHRLVLTDDAGREFVLKITPLVSDPSMLSGYLLTCLGAVLAAPDLAREPALGTRQLLLLCSEKLRITDDLPRRKSRHRHESQIDADLLFDRGQRLYALLQNKRDKVAIRSVFRDRDTAGVSPLWQRTGPDNHEGIRHPGEGQVRAGERKSRFGVGGSLILALCMIGGVSGAPLEEVREGRLQVAQTLLQGYSRDIGQPGGFWLLFEEGEQCGEVLIGQAFARLPIRGAFEAQRKIIDPPATTEGASECPLLFIAWIAAIFVGAFDPAHAPPFFLAGRKVETIGTICSPEGTAFSSPTRQARVFKADILLSQTAHSIILLFKILHTCKQSDARHQMARIIWFDDIIVSARIKSRNFVL